jgi:tetratricopeptide (TPR) repeat protein
MAVRQGASGLAHLGASFASAAELCAKLVATNPTIFQEAASLYWVAVFDDALCRRDTGDLDGACAGLTSIIASDAKKRPVCIDAPPQEIVARAAAEIARAKLQACIVHLELGRYDQAAAIVAEVAAASPEMQMGDPAFFSEVLYRTFKEAVNAGDNAVAESLGQHLRRLLVAEAGADVLSKEGLCTIRQEVLAKAALEDIRPNHLPCSLFYLGMQRLNVAGNAGGAAAMFETAATVTRHMVKLFVVPEPASLYWVQVYHAGLANLIAGNRERSLEWFQQIFDAADALPHDLVQTELLPRDIARAKRQAGIAHLQLGRYDQAAALLAEAAAAPAEVLSRDERTSATSLAETARAASLGQPV